MMSHAFRRLVGTVLAVIALSACVETHERSRIDDPLGSRQEEPMVYGPRVCQRLLESCLENVPHNVEATNVLGSRHACRSRHDNCLVESRRH